MTSSLLKMQQKFADLEKIEDTFLTQVCYIGYIFVDQANNRDTLVPLYTQDD